jgi:predicted secreted protein
MRLNQPFRIHAHLCAAALALTLTSAALAQPAAIEDQSRVARLAVIEGQVSIFRDAEDGWRAARQNAPLQAENSIWTEGASRADVRLGASAFRFGYDTVFDFLRMSGDQALGYLQRGVVQVRVRTYRENDFADKIAVETPNGRAVFESDGRYRVETLASSNETRVTVFAGRARFEQGNSRLAIEPGRELMVRGLGAQFDVRYFTAQDTDLDRWADARDARWDQAHARLNREAMVSPYMTGYEELDEHGEWIDSGDYGRVWAPRVIVSGWAPYRYGHWSYVRPWGWTWIDDAPWGFAPFHYGRWVVIRNRWCWWPGVYHPRPAYAPALVAWFGSNGAGVRLGSGPHVGWFPLAPREHYIPRYSHSPLYANNINYVTGNVRLVPPPRYHNHHHGATFVANDVFIGSRPVGGQYVRRPPADVFNTPIASHVDVRPRLPRDPRVMPDRIQPPAAQGGPSPIAPVIGAPRPVPPVVKRLPEPASTGPAVQPPAPVLKRAPEPILVGPAVAPATETAPSPGALPPAVQTDRPNPGPRVRGRRQPAPDAAPVAPGVMPAPHAVAPSTSTTAPAAPVHAAPAPKPKAEPSAKPKEKDHESGEKPRGEKSSHPKAQVQ